MLDFGRDWRQTCAVCAAWETLGRFDLGLDCGFTLG